ncbi:MAG: hypothetical protein U0798_03720 [Gemmataceae bacterium]
MGEMLRNFGLKDFLENKVDDECTHHEVAEEAIIHFCEGHVKRERIFQFGVISVCYFLHNDYAKQSGSPPVQLLQDLISTISQSCNRQAIMG